jgi:glycosyltransferase involved in cell wall biosynthesis
MSKHKLIRITTVPSSLKGLLKGQLKFMSDSGYEVIGISSSGAALLDVERNEGVRVIPVEMTRKISPAKDLNALLQLYKIFKKEKPYIVHANTPKASLLSMIAAFFARIPHRIYTVTGLRFEGERGIKREILIAMERISCRAATKVIPEGQGVKYTLIKNKITSKKLEVIGNGNINGINIDYFSPESILPQEKIELKSMLNIRPDDIVFCFIGRIVKDKGINELINVFSIINQQNTGIKLLLVGAFERDLDPLLPETEKEIDSNPNIITTGFQSDVRPYLAISDIFVFPSYREGFPNVVMQAGAMDLPCIVTDINGCNEIIKEGINGLIIPPKDKDSLKEKMLLLLNNSDLRFRLKQQAREMITSRYEQRMLWNALLNEYKSL